MNQNPDLSFFPFFSNIPLNRLAEIETFSSLRTFEKGSVIFQNNEPAQNLYGLVQGNVDLTLLFKEEIITKDIKHEDYISTNVEILEKPVVIEKVRTHDIFGWSALVEPEKMTATARCSSDSEIVVIPASNLKEIFSTDPELGYLLTSRISIIISQRLNTRTAKLVNAWCSLFDTEAISAV